jgi:hypothetical protein
MQWRSLLSSGSDSPGEAHELLAGVVPALRNYTEQLSVFGCASCIRSYIDFRGFGTDGNKLGWPCRQRKAACSTPRSQIFFTSAPVNMPSVANAGTSSFMSLQSTSTPMLLLHPAWQACASVQRPCGPSCGPVHHSQNHLAARGCARISTSRA